jgi:DNA invertase Pin-like site-specific DNA recombinase
MPDDLRELPMLNVTLPAAGAADPQAAAQAHKAWTEAAAKTGIDLIGFDSSAPLDQRLAWAEGRGLEIGAILSRYSSRLQHSTSAQVSDCAQAAARYHIYVPPEFICTDEAVSGRKARRDGLQRMRLILQHHLARVLLVFKVSRLFRVAYLGFQFFQEHVVEEGLRAISVSQGIDTADEKAWKPLAYLHGVMDEMLVMAIADHVRAGIKDLFLRGYTTGALTVGYQRVEVPGAPPTNRGLPRTMPQRNEDAAALILQHFRWIRQGMSLKEGWRRWVQAGGPRDPRSKSPHMTYNSYRRLLSNARFTGRWAFGRKRNRWSTKRDYTLQIDQPDTEVVIVESEELRIVDDETFFAVQQRLNELRRGPRGPRKSRPAHLWDTVTDCFYCAQCQVRFYQAGANGHGMTCKRGDLCPCKSTIKRAEAVRAVCRTLATLIRQDDNLVDEVTAQACDRDAAGDETVRDELMKADNLITSLNRKKSEDLSDLAGQGTDEDRAAWKAKVKAAQTERAAAQVQAARLREALAGNSAPITPTQVRELLDSLVQLLEDGAAGVLGADVLYRATAAFRLLVGGRISVHVERRAGRKRSNAQGSFRPNLLRAVHSELQLSKPAEVSEVPEVRVWLRQPPKKDLLAERVHQLMDHDGLSYREAAAALQAEGCNVNSGVVWQVYRRFYEMLGQPVPERPYNNGRPRKAAKLR